MNTGDILGGAGDARGVTYPKIFLKRKGELTRGQFSPILAAAITVIKALSHPKIPRSGSTRRLSSLSGGCSRDESDHREGVSCRARRRVLQGYLRAPHRVPGQRFTPVEIAGQRGSLSSERRRRK